MRWFGMALAGVSLMLAGPVFAQPWGPLQNRNGPQLSQDDLDMVFASANKVNRADEATRATDSWSNPKTGTQGTTSLVKVVKRGEAMCHQLHHKFTLRGGVVRDYDVTWCPTGQGVWKFAD